MTQIQWSTFKQKQKILALDGKLVNELSVIRHSCPLSAIQRDNINALIINTTFFHIKWFIDNCEEGSNNGSIVQYHYEHIFYLCRYNWLWLVFVSKIFHSGISPIYRDLLEMFRRYEKLCLKLHEYISASWVRYDEFLRTMHA